MDFLADVLVLCRLRFTPDADAQGSFYQVPGIGKVDGLVLPALAPRAYERHQSNQLQGW
jgi:hypothetical protein